MLRAIRWAGPGQKWVVEELPDENWEAVLEQAARDFHDPHSSPIPPKPIVTPAPRARGRR